MLGSRRGTTDSSSQTGGPNPVDASLSRHAPTAMSRALSCISSVAVHSSLQSGVLSSRAVLRGGWLIASHLVVEYLCARGWVEEACGGLLSGSYLTLAPLPPPTACPASLPPPRPPEQRPGSCSDSDDSIEAVLIL